MRILGLDFGTKTVGVSMSDPLHMFASAYLTIRRNNPIDVKDTIKKIHEIVLENEIELIVLGYPRNMNHSEGPRCVETNKFKSALEKVIDVPIVLWDERLSTVSAERTLIEANVKREKRREVIDSVAAVYILQGYLDKISKHGLHKMIKEDSYE